MSDLTEEELEKSRAWGNKAETNCDDLINAIFNWLNGTIQSDGGAPEWNGDLNEFLVAIRPESGFRQERGFDSQKPTVRKSTTYKPNLHKMK